MYRTAAAISLLTFGVLALSAQNMPSGAAGPAPVPAQDRSNPLMTLSVNLSANAGGCPISMDARQGLWDHTIRVRDGQKEKIYNGFGQRISLTLTDIHAERIVGATVKVLGLSGHNRMLTTDAMSGPKPDASRIIHLTSFSEAKDGVTAELYAPGFTSVSSIQLLEITYANGSTWSNPNLKVCRVAPDPLMLIAGH